MKKTQMMILGIILTLAILAEITLAVILYDPQRNAAVINTGWVILWISAIFGWLPIITFKKWGRVPGGESYIKTTVLVDRGVYAIVRHPQYLAGILIGLALPLISWHWLIAILGGIVIVITCLGTFDEEQDSIAKFGDVYRQYMQRVPRFNFILGMIRLILSKGKNRS